MKTRLIILSLFVLLLGVQQISAQTVVSDVDVIIDKEESSESGLGRTLTPIIEAQINTLSRLLSLTFNEPVGIVVIAVTNSIGETVASVQCNTSVEPFMQLSVPVDDDTYYIEINGNKISAFATYTILNRFINTNQ
ncbi:MAG: hypothetical protein IKC17_06420 [Bacteroidales bacterium]|nr:hypothetical protein [Bacteroidales bacterium]